MKMFTVYDSKAEAYMQPFFAKSTGEALRSFSDTCQDKNHIFAKHPEDFTLFELGTWDEQTSNFVIYESKKSLGTAIEYATDLFDDTDHLKLA